MDKNLKKILIVEDDKSLRHALEEIISQEGFTAMVASNGEEGLKSALKNHPDLILLDIIMPKMNGLNLLKSLRDDVWGKSVPVLLLTNDTDPEHMRETLKDNATDYLIKSDWEIEDVVKKVKTTLKL